MEEHIISLKKTARLAGLLYLLMSIQAPIALLYIPSHIMVDGNPTSTFNNILNHEFLFRLSIISQLTSTIIFLILALVLYRLFRQVNEYQAKVLVAFVALQVPTTFIIETLNFTSLMIAKGEIMQSVQLVHKQDLAMLLLNIHDYGLLTSEIFWGLWLLPFGLLVYKSGFIPRIFGLCLFYGCMCWISTSFTSLLFPHFHPVVSKIVMETGWIGEIPIMLWLLIIGARISKPR